MILHFPLTKLTVLTTLFTGLALADAFPASLLAPNGVLTNQAVDVLPDPPNPRYPVKFTFGTGGGFEATVAGFDTILWCVDAEEDIWFPTKYSTDIVQLSTVATNASDVRYGNVSGVYSSTTNPTGWALDLGASDNDALARFEMAAYLVSQYGNFPAGPSGNDAASIAMNKEIQTAIWEITWNNSVSPGGGITYAAISSAAPSGVPSATFLPAVQNYINQAQACIDHPASCAFNPANYAVVSGPLTSVTSGDLASLGYQTYIVQLTPEPTSIALLGVVGAWVFFARRRLKKAS